MNTKFSPKFTIATAYPMMFSSDDLKYIETEMLDVIRDKACFPRQSFEASNTKQFEVGETPLDLGGPFRSNAAQPFHIAQQLERMWEVDSTDHPQDVENL